MDDVRAIYNSLNSNLSELLRAARAFYLSKRYITTKVDAKIFSEICKFGYIEFSQVVKYKNKHVKFSNKSDLVFNCLDRKLARVKKNKLSEQDMLQEFRAIMLDLIYEESGLEELEIEKLQDLQDQEEAILGSDGIIDIEYGTRLFLSFHMFMEQPFETHSAYNNVARILKLWLRFLSRNNVCPQFHPSIKNAISVCSLASKQLFSSLAISQLLPGKFSSAVLDNLSSQNTAPFDPKKLGFPQPMLDLYNSHFSNPVLASEYPTDIQILDIIPPFTLIASEYIRDTDDTTTNNTNTNTNINNPQFPLYFEKEIIDSVQKLLVIECTLSTLKNNSKFIHSVTAVWPSYTPFDYDPYENL
ncbi:hypothetical protein BB560_004304 [Smittium megazygosporum]|uniref:Uncharacterized protein n=1 Tax=Smittium megazygosporum TaxID=133381 RepID=A0A2T9Z9L7_9FUNG|nr:hypothetical protein BB560_004304 [Smittium megazygosporum]